jgi:hypothetical protein
VIKLRLGDNAISYHDGHLRTVLPDGSIVLAVAHDTAEYAATAARLGYGADVEKLNRDHDIVHSLLAHWLGLPASPALSGAAREAEGTELTGAEEDAVMAIQRFANLAGIDLAAVALTHRR